MQTDVISLLNKKEQQILSRWQAAASGPDENQKLLPVKKINGQFSDPIGYLMLDNTVKLWKWLTEPENNLDIVKPLEEICKMKAVQQPRPSKALGFVFTLKQILREELLNENDNLETELNDLDCRIDELALLAFDIYSECRARIYELKVNEIKRMYGRDVG